MDYIGIENITPYENTYEFSVYEYDDEITLGSEKLYVNKIKNFVLDEIWVENLVKENIEVIFVES